MARSKKQKAPWNMNQKVTSAIRKVWRTSPMRLIALQKACLTPDAKNYDKTYECAVCKGAFLGQQVEVDHVMSEEAKESWSEFIERMFLHVDKVVYDENNDAYAYSEDGVVEPMTDFVVGKLQVLCKKCHKEEGKKRREASKCKKAKKK
jgi:5-methylcytosine-specific restriction endonuclease McrA